MKFGFTKCHGSGNDFVLIDELNQNLELSKDTRKELAIKLSDRKGIIGSDGLLFLCQSTIADCKMIMYNPDGSQAEMCGNGLRCIARKICERNNTDNAKIEVSGSIHNVHRVDDIYEGVITYSVELNDIFFETEKIGITTNLNEFHEERIIELDENLKFTAIGMPNPHIICSTKASHQEIDSKLKSLGHKVLELNHIFPKGINVSLIKEVEKNKIYCRTFERGVGLTYSCGSAMCASALHYYLNKTNEKSKNIEVINKGGKVICEIIETNKNYNIILTGNATFVYEGEIEVDEITFELSNMMNGKVNLDEITNYAKLVENIDA